LAAGNGVEALRDAVADRIHRRHARLHGWHGAIAAAVSAAVARGEQAGEQTSRDVPSHRVLIADGHGVAVTLLRRLRQQWNVVAAACACPERADARPPNGA